MTLARLFVASALAFIAPLLRAAPAEDERAIENLATFGRLYGYVRFFHPSDEAANLDWDAFGVLGAESVRDAADPASLQRTLRKLFRPIAPTLRIDGPAGDDVAPESEPLAPSARRIHWQHLGVKLHSDPGPYRSQRLVTGNAREERRSLFDDPPERPTHIQKDIGQGLRIRMPLELPVADDGRTTNETPADLAARQAWLVAVKLAQRDPASDWALRTAGVIATWNVFQHFHPYLDHSGVKWEETLRPALHRVLAARSSEDYYATLSELAAQLHDGHGYVYGRKAELGGLPIRVAVFDDQLAVVATKGETPLRRGDIILEVDGVPALELVRESERYISGSLHLRRFRALNQFGEGPRDSIAKILVQRDGVTLAFETPRLANERGFFFKRISPFEFPGYTEVRPGIFYVNIQALDRPAFEEKLPQLAKARGIIFDQRWDGRMPAGNSAAQSRGLQTDADIISHLIDSPVQKSPMLIPKVVAPDRVGWTWAESTWPVSPKAPRFAGRIVFINEPSVVSYGETCMAMIVHYRLATLVGGPTGGCNGSVNFIHLPGGYRVMWTGMEVLKHDRSPFYGVGFLPDHPVVPTLAAVKEGRDEYLERAIAVLEANSPKT